MIHKEEEDLSSSSKEEEDPRGSDKGEEYGHCGVGKEE